MFQCRVSALSFVVGLPTSGSLSGPAHLVTDSVANLVFIIRSWGWWGNRLPCNELCRDF